MMDQKTHYVVWVVSDGVAGHYNQSKGVLLALASQFSLKVYWVEAKLKQSWYRRVLSIVLNRCIPNTSFLPWFYHMGALPAEVPHIVVGAGGKTAYAVAWLARGYGAKNIFCGSLRQLKASLFDAIIVLEQHLPAPFLTVKTAPMPVSQHSIEQAAQQWHATHQMQHQSGRYWTVLIGGDGAGARYQEADWQQLAEQLNVLAAQQQVQLLISTSRRTGGVAEQILQQILQPQHVADAVWWSEEPRAVVSAFLGLSGLVLCTVDSMSMMMESVTAMRGVIAVQPACFLPDERYAAALDNLTQARLIKLSNMTALPEVGACLSQLKPLQREPSQVLVEQLIQRLDLVTVR